MGVITMLATATSTQFMSAFWETKHALFATDALFQRRLHHNRVKKDIFRVCRFCVNELYVWVLIDGFELIVVGTLFNLLWYRESKMLC